MANVQKFNFCNSRFKSSSNFSLNLNKFYVLKAMIIDQTKYLCVTFILFLIGLSGIFLNRKNIIIMLMLIELMLLSINFNLIVLFSILFYIIFYTRECIWINFINCFFLNIFCNFWFF